MKNINFLAILSLVTLLALTGCTSLPILDSSSPDYQKTVSFAPIPDKAVLYIYRSRLSDFQGLATSVDIGDVELDIFPNCVHRFELAAGTYSMEPNGVGTFAIEEELSITLEKGSVHFVELRHTSRIAVPNVSALIEQSKDELEKVMASDALNVVPIKVI